MPETFTVTEQHLALSRRMNIRWYDGHFGGPGVDIKRPYGNSAPYTDMVNILKLDTKPIEYEEYPSDVMAKLDKLHMEMETALQIFLCTGEIRTGTYEKTDNYDNRSWVRKDW